MKMTGRPVVAVEEVARDGCDPHATASSATTRTSKKKGLVIADEALIPRFKSTNARSELDANSQPEAPLPCVPSQPSCVDSRLQEVGIRGGCPGIAQLSDRIRRAAGVL